MEVENKYSMRHCSGKILAKLLDGWLGLDCDEGRGKLR